MRSARLHRHESRGRKRQKGPARRALHGVAWSASGLGVGATPRPASDCGDADPLRRVAVTASADRELPLARQRVALLYALRHGRRLDWDRPARFTELVQLRKLFDHSPAQPPMMDKLAAKRLGEEWVVPTLWHGTALPFLIPFPVPAIVKARHGCNQYQPIPSMPNCDRWQQLRRIARRWQRRPYGRWLDEWAYRGVPRAIVAEPLLGGKLPLPIDYKIYVFGGVATHVQVHLGHGRRHRWVLHGRCWRQFVRGADEPPPTRHWPRCWRQLRRWPAT